MSKCHEVPAFGCQTCINSDRAAWAIKTYEDWKKSYKIPKCPGCGETMIHYGKNEYPSKLEAILICPSHDDDGVPTCEEHDLVMVIG